MSVVAAGAEEVAVASVVVAVEDGVSVTAVDAADEVTDGTDGTEVTEEVALAVLPASPVTDVADDTESADDVLLAAAVVGSVVTGSMVREDVDDVEELEDVDEIEDEEESEETEDADVSAPSVSDDPVIAARSAAASSVTCVAKPSGTTSSGGFRSVFQRKSILRSG